jgi:hAT family C-terminal dimerisation region
VDKCEGIQINPIPSTTPAPPNAASAVDKTLADVSRHHLCTSINNAWSKLEKYYNCTDRSRAYFGSVRMHPALNEAWFSENWNDDEQLEWLEAAERRLRKHYDEHYRRLRNPASYPEPPQAVQGDSSPSDRDAFDGFLTPASLRTQSPTMDNYDCFKSLNPIRDAFRRPLEWWRDHVDEYPTISQMALDFFSVPAMSAECERIFSLAKMTLTSQRQSMTDATLEALICLKAWGSSDRRGSSQ